MSLNWDITNVANRDSVCWLADPTKEAPERRRLNFVTEALIWATLAVDIGTITADNISEWQWRLAFLDQCGNRGKFLVTPVKKGSKKLEERGFTDDELRQHIGLRTNVTTTTRKAWLAKQLRILSAETDRKLRPIH